MKETEAPGPNRTRQSVSLYSRTVDNAEPPECKETRRANLSEEQTKVKKEDVIALKIENENKIGHE